MARIYAHLVHKARYLNARIGGQVIDKAGVQYVAADLIRVAGDHSFHNVGGIFAGTGVLHFAVLQNAFFFFLPALDLVDAAARVFVQRNVELFNKLRVTGLDEERIVFRVMLAGFGAVVAEAANVLIAHHIFVLFGRILFCGAALDLGIEVVAVLVFNLQKPAHVIDAGDELAATFNLIFHAKGL